MRKILVWSSAFAMLLGTAEARAEWRLWTEAGTAWATRNIFRIPGDTGTLVRAHDFGRPATFSTRIYASFGWNERHEIRALWAPYSVRLNATPDTAINFLDASFAAGTDTAILYKFNSYRLTYLYRWYDTKPWHLAIGFTAKIRDAAIGLTQGALTRTKANVGFVPLLHFQARRFFGESWALALDLDGLAAPQGRAFDLGLFLEKSWSSALPLTARVGYRMVEGGADNDEVYNFAWVQSAVFGLEARF